MQGFSWRRLLPACHARLSRWPAEVVSMATAPARCDSPFPSYSTRVLQVVQHPRRRASFLRSNEDERIVHPAVPVGGARRGAVSPRRQTPAGCARAPPAAGGSAGSPRATPFAPPPNGSVPGRAAKPCLATCAPHTRMRSRYRPGDGWSATRSSAPHTRMRSSIVCKSLRAKPCLTTCAPPPRFRP